jgi:hypothetical protein
VVVPVGMSLTSPSAHFNNAVEYHHTGFEHYFTTILADEVTKLDSNLLTGWDRTGEAFRVAVSGTAGYANVCRFFSASFAPLSSHFYTPVASECAFNRTDPARSRVWTFEGEVFAVLLAGPNGECSSGFVPLYRLYNNGQGGAPNHRYTVSVTTRAQMIGQGWAPEGNGIGVIACVLPST